MKFKRELVLQFPASSIEDYDAIVELEQRIIANLGEVGDVDGHDMGAGEMNIFIRTDHPKLVFGKVMSLLNTLRVRPELKAAHRAVRGDDYTILYPPSLRHFSIA